VNCGVARGFRPRERSAQSAQNSGFSAVPAISVLIVGVLLPACGKKGPPLPPLVKIPAAPAELVADRRGATVDLQFTVPSSNTDNSRPANIERVDVYAITASPSITDDQLLKRGARVASIDVKAPRDPNQTVQEDEPAEDVDPAVGKGLDQGAVARVSEELTPQSLAPADLGKDGDRAAKRRAGDVPHGPLMGPAAGVPSRIYAAVGVSTRGRKGALSKRAVAPLVPPPPPPEQPKLSYDEKEVTLTWNAVALPAASATDGDVLPSKPIGVQAPSIAYNVYDVSADAATKITKTPVKDTKVSDPRIAWGERRCYTVRAVESLAGLTIESDAAPPACETLTDTFAPAAPKGLRSIAGERSINLIWDPNSESDLAGYLVFRGTGDKLDQVTPAPIADPTFTDGVQPGVRYVYAIKAVDKAGNSSAWSERVEEMAR
jgi:hypothetical protein